MLILGVGYTLEMPNEEKGEEIGEENCFGQREVNPVCPQERQPRPAEERKKKRRREKRWKNVVPCPQSLNCEADKDESGQEASGRDIPTKNRYHELEGEERQENEG